MAGDGEQCGEGWRSGSGWVEVNPRKLKDGEDMVLCERGERGTRVACGGYCLHDDWIVMGVPKLLCV